MSALPASFFHQAPERCARELIGATLRYRECSARIVETEAYAAHRDEACHSFYKTKGRSFVENNTPGAAFVYLTYGMYWMVNMLVLSPEGEPGFVLLRALEPLEGIAVMQERRGRQKVTDLCTGPGKLAIALGIDGNQHEGDFLGNPFRLFARDEEPPVVAGPRIGISKAKDTPWRFGWASHAHLSQPFAT